MERTYVNLEPLLAAAVAGAEVASALVHPHHDGALRVCPLLPDSPDLSSSGDRCAQVGLCSTVAHDLLVSN